MSGERFIGTVEAASILQCTEMTVRRYLKNGKIEYFRFGRNARIPLSGLLKFKEECRIPAAKDEAVE